MEQIDGCHQVFMVQITKDSLWNSGKTVEVQLPLEGLILILRFKVILHDPLKNKNSKVKNGVGPHLCEIILSVLRG
jgi:hypothetical protein